MTGATRASAPGKVLLAGEYAVLEGSTAAIMAVNRRAYAHLASSAPSRSPFIQAAAEVLVARYGADSARAKAAARVMVDTQELMSPADRTPTKLGLGSSAAATVAAIACALDLPNTSESLNLIHRFAHTAHRNAQAREGSPGSGADVAASVHGGILIVEPSVDRPDRSDRRDGSDAPPSIRRACLPPGLTLVFVWTGVPADTRVLVRQVHAAQRARPGRIRSSIAAISEAAAKLVANLTPGGSAMDAIDAIRLGGLAISDLGRAAGAPLWRQEHTRIEELAGRAGGTAKPTGAGGGDIALCALPSPEKAADLRKDLVDQGLSPLELDVDPRGAIVAANPPAGPGHL